jgi:hypothetical protein
MDRPETKFSLNQTELWKSCYGNIHLAKHN